nr:hypothetical protein [Methanothermus fervidus]
MDEKGLIFTTDSIIALTIVFIFLTSILNYYVLPEYIGSDQQRLSDIAADTLNILEQDGSLITAAVKYSNGNVTGAGYIIGTKLNETLYPDIGYRFLIDGHEVARKDIPGLVHKDVASRVKVVSAPQEGWLGRAWYYIPEVPFEDKQINTTTTVWNFHNWLTNFNPWRYGGLYNYPYWGCDRWKRPVPINCSLPQNTTINSVKWIIGSACNNNDRFSANLVLNGQNNYAYKSAFKYLYYSNIWYFYMYYGNATRLIPGNNSFYVAFLNMSSYSYDMPWFSLIANYTTTIKVPKTVTFQTFPLQDLAGIGAPTSRYFFDLNTGKLTSAPALTISWNDLIGKDNPNAENQVFRLRDIPSSTTEGSAVCSVTDVPIPSNVTVHDAYVVLNPYGSVDGAVVEVNNGEGWQVVFCSFNYNGTSYSAVGDGYGNLPGIIYIGDKLKAGVNNRVRVTIWDYAPGGDYDFVGLVNSYVSVSYSSLGVKWLNFPFNSYQSDTNINTQERLISVGQDAKRIYLFMGVGLDTKRVTVEVKDPKTGQYKLYYDGMPQFAIDLGSIDRQNNYNILTSGGTPDNYTCNPGDYYVRVTVYGPSRGWESGDNYAEIFSGTRVAVIYTTFTHVWATSFNETASGAIENAKQNLIQKLQSAGYNVDPNAIQAEALYTGNLPNAIPVRLDLWRD